MTVKIAEALSGKQSPTADYKGGYFTLHQAGTHIRVYASIKPNLAERAPFQVSLGDDGLPVIDLWIDNPAKYDIAFFTRAGAPIAGAAGLLSNFLATLMPVSDGGASGEIEDLAADLAALTATVAGKASTASVTALTTTVNGKAATSTVTALSGRVDGIDTRVTALENPA